MDGPRKRSIKPDKSIFFKIRNQKKIIIFLFRIIILSPPFIEGIFDDLVMARSIIFEIFLSQNSRNLSSCHLNDGIVMGFLNQRNFKPTTNYFNLKMKGFVGILLMGLF